jgi:glycine amidinotransferase
VDTRVLPQGATPRHCGDSAGNGRTRRGDGESGDPSGLATSVPPSPVLAASAPPVWSHNEWDPLEEVIVGRIQGGVFPTWQPSMMWVLPVGSWRLLQTKQGRPFPREQVAAAERQLEGLAQRLESLGVTVARPEGVNHSEQFALPGWERPSSGLYSAMPRDSLLAIGDCIIEAPMSWRSRQYESLAFRALIKDYFRRGARWLQGPRPQLTGELFVDELGPDDHRAGSAAQAITEHEPVFDAADFVRFGRDIVAQTSHVTNRFGISWLARSLGPEYSVHVVDVNDPHAMHIDATIVPLAPGKLLVHPQRFIPSNLFAGWEIRRAPSPSLPEGWPLYFSSAWLSMNVLSLDHDTVVVEENETSLIEMLTNWGFECVPVPFRHVYTFGGSVHCATLDVRRRGQLTTHLAPA